MDGQIRLFEYLQECSSAYHTVQVSKRHLKAQGFRALHLDEEWNLEPGNYYIDVYGSTVIGIHIGQDFRESLRIVSAHTDFPCLKLKPNPLMAVRNHYGKLNVEAYGGLILSTWMDRPLAISGVLVCRGKSPFDTRRIAIDTKRPVCVIPNLAIHMNRKMNEGVALNKQKDLLPLCLLYDDGEDCGQEDKWLSLLAEEACVKGEDILSYELNVYPCESPKLVGFHEEFITAPRLDNLTSCKGVLEALMRVKSTAKGLRIAVLFDNEEVGSRTKQGGASSLLPQILHRLYGALGATEEACYADIAKGFMVSVDVAHALHPNAPEKNDLTNFPVLSKGLAFKVAASQSYAGDATAQAIVKALSEKANVPYQMYVNRSDIPGGSTVGSITSAIMAMRTMDVGIPILAMHSACETMGRDDQKHLEDFLGVFMA